MPRKKSKKKSKGYDDLTIFEKGRLHSLKGSLIEKDMADRISKADAKVGVKKLVRKFLESEKAL